MLSPLNTKLFNCLSIIQCGLLMTVGPQAEALCVKISPIFHTLFLANLTDRQVYAAHRYHKQYFFFGQ